MIKITGTITDQYLEEYQKIKEFVLEREKLILQEDTGTRPNNLTDDDVTIAFMLANTIAVGLYKNKELINLPSSIMTSKSEVKWEKKS